MNADFGRTSRDYGQYRAGFPDAFFERLIDAGFVAPGDRVLDLGTGTGTIARGLARRGCRVTGLDPAREQIAEAERLDRAAGVAVEYVVAKAEATTLPDHAFNVVTAGQCWYWFDRPRVGTEIRRLLLGGGRLIIANFDRLAHTDNVVEATDRLLRAHSPRLTPRRTNGIYPDWLTDMASAGFGRLETFSFDVALVYTHEAWRGRIRASAGVGAILPPEKVAQFDAELATLLSQRFPEPLSVPHRVWAAIGVAPGGP